MFKNPIPHSTGGPYTSYSLLWTFSAGGSVDSTPAVADLDGDPSNGLEIVFGSWNTIPIWRRNPGI